jgi:hypothetical protein
MSPAQEAARDAHRSSQKANGIFRVIPNLLITTQKEDKEQGRRKRRRRSWIRRGTLSFSF